VEQAIACLADKHMSGKLNEWEVKKINKRLAAIIKANYVGNDSISDQPKNQNGFFDTEGGVGCISCNSTFAVCPHCVGNAIISEHPKNLKGFFGMARYLKDILPRKMYYSLFYSCFNY
jgi:hypothetical protein